MKHYLVKVCSIYSLSGRKRIPVGGENEKIASIGGTDHEKATVLSQVSKMLSRGYTWNNHFIYFVTACEHEAQKVAKFEDDFKEDLLSICEVRFKLCCTMAMCLQ